MRIEWLFQEVQNLMSFLFCVGKLSAGSLNRGYGANGDGDGCITEGSVGFGVVSVSSSLMQNIRWMFKIVNFRGERRGLITFQRIIKHQKISKNPNQYFVQFSKNYIILLNLGVINRTSSMGTNFSNSVPFIDQLIVHLRKSMHSIQGRRLFLHFTKHPYFPLKESMKDWKDFSVGCGTVIYEWLFLSSNVVNHLSGQYLFSRVSAMWSC